MNRHFVNIKVDREERPDLDQIYQLAHAMLTQRGGGWPLTMFLMPDGTPFFGGHLLPEARAPRHAGLPRSAAAHRRRLPRQARRDRKAECRPRSRRFERTLPETAGDTVLERAPLATAVRELAQVFDDVHGGIGRAPKFPHPVRARLLPAAPRARRRRAGPRDRASHAREDGRGRHLRPGRAAASAATAWTSTGAIPHFEKMLYDNAALLALYSRRVARDRPARCSSASRGTPCAGSMREMLSPDGRLLFLARRRLRARGGQVLRLDAGGSARARSRPRSTRWSSRTTASTAAEFRRPGTGICGSRSRLPIVAERLGMPLAECEARLAVRAREAPRRAGDARAPGPRRQGADELERADDPRARARGARVRRAGLARCRAARARFRASAAVAARRGRWRRTAGSPRPARTGVAHLNAYLDDHAFLLDALIELMQCEFRERRTCSSRASSRKSCSSASRTAPRAASTSCPTTTSS